MAQNLALLDKALQQEGVSGRAADFVKSIYQQESSSGGNTKTSNAGAVGGMQIIPTTFSSVADKGWDINNPEHNIRAGIRYASQMYDKAGGDIKLAAAGYYGGDGGLNKARRGVAVSDPRNPNAPDTLEYGDQVASRVGGGEKIVGLLSEMGDINAKPTQNKSGGKSTGDRVIGLYSELYPQPAVAPKVEQKKSPTAGDYAKQFGSSALDAIESIGKGGAEFVAKGLNKVTGTDDYYVKEQGPVGRVAESVRDSMTPGGKAASQTGDVISGDVFNPKTWEVTGDKEKLAMFGLQALGSLATWIIPGAAAMRAPRTAGAVSGAVGALSTAGDQAGDARANADQYLSERTHEQLMSEIPHYAEVFNKTHNEQYARQAVVNDAGFLSAVLSAPLGAAEGTLIGRILPQGLPKVPGVGDIANPILRRSAGVAGGAVIEGGQEAAEKSLGNMGENIATGRDALSDVTRNTLPEALGGGLVGGGIGGLTASKSKGQQIIDFLKRQKGIQADITENQERAVTQQQPIIPPSDQQTQDADLLNAINSQTGSEAINASDILEGENDSIPNAEQSAEVATQASQERLDNTQGSIGDQLSTSEFNGTGSSNAATSGNSINNDIRAGVDGESGGLSLDQSPTNPLQMDASPVDQKANEAATSSQNDLAEPTEAQKNAGNYKVGRIKVGGLNISVENPDQSTRKGVDRDGKAWESTMNGHYGYVRGDGVKARAPDKEHIDVNVKAGTAEDYAGDVFIVNQNDPRTGKFDEPKIYMGYADEAEAEAAYRSNYTPDWQGFGDIVRLPMAKFKEMLGNEKAFLKPVKAAKPPKARKAAKANTLLTAIDSLGGIDNKYKWDISGEQKFARGGYNKIFRNASTKTLEQHIENGDLDEFLPYEMRSTATNDATAGRNYLADRIRNGDRVLPYDVELEAKQSKAYESDQLQADIESAITDDALDLDTVNALLREAGYEEREQQNESRYVETESTDSGSTNTAENTESESAASSIAGNQGREASQSTAKNENNGTTGSKDQERPGVREIVTAIIRRRSAANQIGKDKAFDEYLAVAKEFLNGKDIKPARFKLASATFKNDQPLSDAYAQLAELAQAPAKEARANTSSNIEQFIQRIDQATTADKLRDIARDVQKSGLTDAQIEKLDDLAMEKLDALDGQADNGDLLGDDTAKKQAVADAERAKDTKRNSGESDSSDFVLTGSNSEADKAAARGAQDLFSQPKTGSAPEASSGKPKQSTDNVEKNQFSDTKRFAEWALDKTEPKTEVVEIDGKRYTKTSRIYKGNLGARATKLREEIGAAQSVFLINNETETLEVRAGGRYREQYGDVTVISVKYEPLEEQVSTTEVAQAADYIANESELDATRIDNGYKHRVLSSTSGIIKIERQDYVNAVNSLYNDLLPIAKNDAQKEALKELTAEFKQEYIKRRYRVMDIGSTVVSSAVAGRSKFNSKQSSSRGNALDRAENDFSDWLKSKPAQIKEKINALKSDAELAEEKAKADEKAAKNKESLMKIMRNIDQFKPGDTVKFGSYNIARVSFDRDGYPNSVTVDATDLTDNKFELARTLFGGSKEKLRALVDEIRAENVPEPTQEAAASEKSESEKVVLTVENAILEIEKAKKKGRNAVYIELGTIRGLSNSVFNGVARSLTGSYLFDGREWSQAGLTDYIMADNEEKSPQSTEAAAAEEVTQTETTPLTLFDNAMEAYRNGTATVEEYKAAFDYVLNNEQAITDYLEANFTKQQLFDRGGRYLESRYKSEKKDRVVRALYGDMVTGFLLPSESGLTSFSHGFGNDRYKDVIRQVGGITQESLNAAMLRRQEAIKENEERRAERIKGMADPKTLDDYQAFMREKTSEGMSFQDARMTLTQAQREQYDDLVASYNREQRRGAKNAQKTQVQAAVTTTSGDIVETKHTKTGEPLFVVKAAERVERETYNQWNATAKRMGGYYSSFRGNGAVPGFQFKTRDNAEAFLKYLGGDVDQAKEAIQAKRDSYADDRSQTAVERLNEMADRLAADANEELNRDRKVNTSRRAGMAARAEARASENKAMAVTMRNIAAAIESGKAKYLDAVRQKVQVELLQSSVSSAQQKRLREMYPSYADYEKHRYDPPTAESADYAEFPTYTLNRSDWARLGRAMVNVDGLKAIGTKILSFADDVTDAYLKFAKENIGKVSNFTRADGQRAVFKSKTDAELAIAKNGFNGKAIVLPYKRGENIIIDSPAAAKEKGVWPGDDDKRISMSSDFGKEVVEKIGRANRRANKLNMPWQLEAVYDKRQKLARMDIETPAEYRAALREFIGLKETAAAPDKVKELERSMVGRRNDGLDFFPTPAEVADTMIDVADIQDGMNVLEPSAGMGHIAERIRTAGFEPDVVEFNGDRRELLELKGFNVVGNDFLEQSEKYDRIIMNPPFSNRRDEQHVRHAYDLLKPGGRIVAIMGEGVFIGSDKRATEFRDWLESVGGTSEKLPDGTFNDASLPVNTSANARMVVINKSDSDDTPVFSRKDDSAPAFYSQLSKAIDQAKFESSPGKQWKLWLLGNASKLGVKKDEIQWTGITDWLELQTGKVSKADIQAYLEGIKEAPNKKKPQEIKDKAIELYSDGLSSGAVASTLNIGETTVLRWVKSAGITRTVAETKGVTSEKIESAVTFYQDGNSVAESAKKAGIGNSTLFRVLQARDLTRTLAEVTQVPEAIKKQALDLFSSGMTSYEVADELGLVQATVSKWAKEAGISRGYSGAQALRVANGRLTGYGIKAKFKSDKNNAELRADSVYELARFYQLESDDSVESFSRSKDRIPYGNNQTYVPDIEVLYKDGTKSVEEIKPAFRVDDENVQAKAKGAKQYYSDKNTEYKIITEYHIGIENFDKVSPENVVDNADDVKRVKASLASVRWSLNKPDSITPDMAEKISGGLPLFKRDPMAEGGLTFERAQEITSELQAKYQNLPIVKLVKNRNEIPLPESVKAEINNAIKNKRGLLEKAQKAETQPEKYKYLMKSLSVKVNDVEGMYQNGQVWINVGAIQDEARLREVFAHETIGHLSIEAMLNEVDRGLFPKLLKNVQNLNKMGNKYIQEVWNDVARKQPGLSASNHAKEVLAFIVERGDQNKEFTPMVRTLWQRIVDGIKAFAKLVFNVDLNDSDVRDIMSMAERYAKGDINKSDLTSVMAGGNAYFSMADADQENTDIEFAREVLSELGAEDGFFRHPLSKSTSLQTVMSEVYPDSKYVGDATREDERTESGADKRTLFRNEHGKDFYVYEKGREVWIDVSRFDEGEQGGSVYAAVGNYAHNAKKVFIGDPAGLSEAAVVRRTKHMLGLALRFGTTDFIEPSPEQLLGDKEKGIAPIKWGNNDVENTRNLIDTFISNTENKYPQLAGYSYDFGRREFIDADGRPVSGERFSEGAKGQVARRARTGAATLRAFILAKSLVQSASRQESRGILQRVLNGSRALTKSGQPLSGLFSRGGGNEPPSFSRTSQMPLHPDWDSLNDSGMLTDLQYKFQDKHADLKAVIKAIKATGREISDRFNPYLQEELYHGRVAKRVQDFTKKELEPLLQAMNESGVSMADFEHFLWARHAEERNAQIAKINPDMPDGGSGLTNKEAADYLAQIPAKQMATFKKLAEQVDAINAKSRNLLVEYGLEDMDTAAKMEEAYKHYVPLMRDEMEKGHGSGTGQGFSIKGNSTKRAMGSNKAVVDIIANIAAQREKFIVRGEKNRVSTALVGLAKMNPNDDFWKVDKPPVIRYISNVTGLVEEMTDPNYKNRNNVVVARILDRGGRVQERAVVFNEYDERALRMAESLKNLDVDGMEEWIGNIAKGTRYFASVNTQYNPLFGIVNITRDVQAGALNLESTKLAGMQKEVIGQTYNAWLGIYKDLRNSRKGKKTAGHWSELWEEYQSEGGQTGYRELFRTAKDRTDELNKIVDPDWWKKKGWGKIVSLNSEMVANAEALAADKVGKPIFQWLDDYNASLENSVRLAAYKAGLDKGLSKQEAASIAKNLTVNFNRKGAAGARMGAFYAFFNASVQGTARIGETMFKDGKLSGVGKKILTGGILLGVIQALALAGFDDEEPPQFERDRNLIIPVGGNKYVKIPMPLGFHVIPATARILTEYALNGGEDTAKMIAHLGEVYADAFNPVGGSSSLAQILSPTVFDPIVDLTINEDFAGRQIAQKDFNSLDPTPGFTRAKDTASRVSTVLAHVLNNMTGGSDYQPGVFSPTPDQIDYLTGQIFGGVGREILKVDTTVRSIADGTDLPTYKIPLVGKFYGDAASKSSEGRKFYANIERMNGHENEIKGRNADGKPVQPYLDANPDARLWRQSKFIYSTVKKMQKRRDALLKSGAPADEIQEIDTRITQRMKALNDMVDSAKK